MDWTLRAAIKLRRLHEKWSLERLSEETFRLARDTGAGFVGVAPEEILFIEQNRIEPTGEQVKTITTALGIDPLSHRAPPYDLHDAQNEIMELRSKIGELRQRIDRVGAQKAPQSVWWALIVVFLVIVIVRLIVVAVR